MDAGASAGFAFAFTMRDALRQLIPAGMQMLRSNERFEQMPF